MNQLQTPRLVVRLLGAAMLLAQGAVHLRLWLEGYRQIPVVGPLFLAGVVAAFVLAVAVVLVPRRSVVAAGIGLSLAQVGGLVMSRVTGIFGFMTQGWLSPSEGRAVATELLAAVLLGLLLVMRNRPELLPDVLRRDA